jgi:hypothetical protein
MSAFILAWVLVVSDGQYRITYSPPVQTLEDCQRLQAHVDKHSYGNSKCMQLNVLARGKL